MTAVAGRSAVARLRKVGAAFEPDTGPEKIRFRVWVAKVAANVPEEVTGEPETLKMFGRVIPTEVTVPPPEPDISPQPSTPFIN